MVRLFVPLFHFITCVFYSIQVYAIEFPIDVYGTDSKTSEKIIKKVESDLQNIAKMVHLQNTKHSPENKEQETKRLALKQKIIKDINSTKEFAYVKLSPIIYEDFSIYTTIDLIEKKDHKRLSYIKKHKFKLTGDIIKLRKDKKINKLIERWAAYEEKGFELIFNGKPIERKKCPVYHFLFGFDDPNLKSYLPFFQKEVPENKKKTNHYLKKRSRCRQKKNRRLFISAY